MPPSSSPSAFDFLLGDPNASPVDVAPVKVKKEPLATFPSLDWLVLDNDVSAPHPDAFELELESLAALGGLDADLAVLQPIINPVDQFNPTDLGLFSQYRSSQYNTYSAYSGYGGAPSTITASSETLSAYGSVYEPYEKFPEPTAAQPTGAQHHHSAGDISASLSTLFPDIDLNFSAFNLAAASANSSNQEQQIMLPRLNIDTTSSSTGESRTHGTSSAYDSASSAASAYAGAPAYGTSHPSLAGGIAAAANPKVEHTAPDNQSDTDPRKKYQCPTCPRAFARAFNLKTHMATHDPHRVKNFVCRHSGCGRSFSRKHDLGRHLVSIHQDTNPAAVSSSSTSPIASGSKSSRVSPTGSIGVGAGDKQRVWCDNCGRGWLAGSRDTCDCDKEEE